MDRGADDTDDDLTYAEAGVDIERSEATTSALINALGGTGIGDYAGIIDLGDRLLGLATDGVGTKLLVAAAIDDYSTVGIDCIAMNVNDLVASGIEPLAFVDYLAVDEPNERIAEQIGRGLAAGAEAAEITLIGGETAVMPEVITGVDLAGTCAGVAPHDGIIAGNARPGDVLVGYRSSGIHSNGLTLARKAVIRNHQFSDPFPPNPDLTIGEELLRPTRLYHGLLDSMRSHDVTAAAHITGGGWTNLERIGDVKCEVFDPFDPHPIFPFIRNEGGVELTEMYRTFNMGLGFVVSISSDGADSFVVETDGRIIGRVNAGSGVDVDGLEL